MIINNKTKENKMDILKTIELKKDQKMIIKVSENSFVEVSKTRNGFVNVDVIHYETKITNKVEVNNVIDYLQYEDTSWSNCQTSFKENESIFTVNHTAYNNS